MNGAVLQERCDLIKWILKQMGLPSEPFRVETLEIPGEMPKDSTQLCTVLENGKERLGVFAPLKPSDQKKSLPRPPHDLPLFLGHSVLRTDVHWEHELLMDGDTSEMSAPLDDDARSVSSSVPSEHTWSPQAAKLKRFCHSLEEKLLIEFSRPGWTKTAPESQFSVFITKLQTVRQEAAFRRS